MPTGSSRKCLPGCTCKRHQNGMTGRTEKTTELRRAAKLGTTRPPEAIAKGMETKLANGNWDRGDDVGYHGVHKRLKKQYGEASGLLCDWCGDAARTWSYNHLDPTEKWWRGMAYTTNLEFYMPLCDACHVVFDKECKEAELWRNLSLQQSQELE